MGNEERTEGGDVERLLDVGGVEIDEWAAGAEARIVDHDVWRSKGAVDIGEQLVDLSALARVAGEGPRPGFLHQRREIVGAARRERDLDAVLGQRPCERGGQSRTRADDQRGSESGVCHGEIRFRRVALGGMLTRQADRRRWHPQARTVRWDNRREGGRENSDGPPEICRSGCEKGSGGISVPARVAGRSYRAATAGTVGCEWCA